MDSLRDRCVAMVRSTLRTLMGSAGNDRQSADTLAEIDSEEEEEMAGVLGEPLVYHSRGRNFGAEPSSDLVGDM
jgi:hypothetical protein